MQSIYRLKKNYQYNYVYKHSESVADSNFIMLYCASRSNPTKVGFSVSKKFGKAVYRNRIRRQMKAAVSAVMPDVAIGYHVIFIPRKHQSYNYGAVSQSVVSLFKKAGLLS